MKKKLIPESRVIYEVERISAGMEPLIRREMVKHPKHEVDKVVADHLIRIESISEVVDPMSRNKLNVIIAMGDRKKAFFVWDEKSLREAIHWLYSDFTGSMTKIQGRFYV